MYKPSLSNRFALYVALAGFLVIAAFMTYETFLENSRRITHQMETEVTRVDRALIIEIEHSSHLVQAIGQQLTHMDISDQQSIAYLLRSFDTTATIHHVFSWIDASGKNIVSSNKGVHPPVDVSDRDYVKECMAEPWKIHIGKAMHGRVSDKWVLPVSIGVADPTGKYLGTIVISMEIYTVIADLQRAVKEKGITLAIYSKDLFPLSESIVGETLILLDNYSKKLKLVNLTEHPSGVMATADLFDLDSMQIYYETSSTYPYIMILGLNHDASMRAFRTLLIPRLIELFLLGAFLAGILLLVKYYIIRPITELAEAAAGITRGKPYNNPIDSGSLAELYFLAQQIKKLSDYLSEVRLIEEENKNKNIILRNSMEAADLSNKIKIDFMKSMSHRLRTPLNNIIGFSEIMKNQTFGTIENKQYLQYIKDIYESSKKLQFLTEDMQKLLNIETGMIELQEKHIDVRFILSKSIRIVSEQLGDSNFNVELKLPEILPRLLMDEQRLRQIIVNIIVHMTGNTTGGHIVIKAYMEQDQKGRESFCISFTDLKSGEEEGRINKVRSHDMSHLGIPLIKALLSMHQAQLEIKTPIGKSAIIVLRFPKERLVS